MMKLEYAHQKIIIMFFDDFSREYLEKLYSFFTEKQLIDNVFTEIFKIHQNVNNLLIAI